jgi:hypothetical protein
VQDTPEEVKGLITNFIGLIVRGVTLQQPKALAVHGHRDVLFIKADLPPVPPEEIGAVVELMLLNCPNFTLTPATSIHQADFKGEWPPRSLIQEMLQPKLIVPGGVQPVSKLVGAKR